MKLRTIILLCALVAVLAASCVDVEQPMATKEYHWADSTAHAYMTMDAELPSGTDKASARVRQELESVVDDILSHVTSYENERFFDPFDGDSDDIEGMLGYYRENAFALIGRQSQEDADERAKYILEDEDFSDEEKAEMLRDFPSSRPCRRYLKPG